MKVARLIMTCSQKVSHSNNSLLPIRSHSCCWVCKVWALVSQGLSRCFPFYGVWWTSQMIRSVDISESVVINQSIFINQCYRIVEFHRNVLVFSYNPSKFNIFNHVRGVSYSKKLKSWNSCFIILKPLMVI